MKKSMLLLETILSFFIMSIIFLFSTILYSTILQTDKTQFENTLHQGDLFATKLFIGKHLKNGSIKEVNSQEIAFYSFDREAFLQNFYSGIIDLKNSTALKAYTPNSQTTKLQSSYILFENNSLFELSKSAEDNFLYFKNPNSKTVYEHYSVVKNSSSIIFKNNQLFFNNHLLQNNVTKFHAQYLNALLHIDICIQQSCQEWIF